MVKAKLTVKQKNKMTVALIGAAVILAVLFVATRLNFPWEAGSSDDNTTVAVDEVLVAGMEYGDRGDVEGGLDYYDSQISLHKNSPEAQQLLLYKSSFALNAGRHDEALESAKRADEMGSNTATVAALAQVYRKNGDNKTAIELYKKLIAAAPGDGGMGDRDLHEWKMVIEELEG